MYAPQSNQQHWIPIAMPEILTMPESLTPQEAGALIKKRRLEVGLTQDQLVARTGLSSQSYLSALEKGRYNIGRSEHFAAVARELRLSAEDIRLINPDAFMTVLEHQGPGQTPDEVPAGLLEAAQKYGGKFPALLKRRVQEQLSSARFFDGIGPQTAEEWRDYYTSVSRWISDKD